jgi:hypothetical protein
MTKLSSLLAITVLVSACSSAPGSGGPNPPAGGSGGAPTTGGSGGSGPSGTGGSTGGSGGYGGEGGTTPPGTGGSGAGGSSGTGGSGAGGSSGTGGSTADGGGTPGTGGAGAGGTGGSTPVAAEESAILTNRYDNLRTGSTLQEKILTPANVTKDGFGLLFSRSINGLVYGQPLYVPGLMINGAKHNVLYVATASNIVYAFDADDPAANAPLWMKMLEAPFPLTDGYPSCADMKASGKAGITSTPVIDLQQGKIFVVTKSTDSTRLHALDLLTGADSSMVATLSAPMFNSKMHLNRPGLLLLDGTIYIAFSSHCDDNPYHGWVFAIDSKTMQAKGVFNTTPSGSRGGIWQSGVGPLGDANGVAFCVGNGDFGGMNLGESVVRIKQMGNTLALAEKYTPGNAADLNSADNDLTAGVTGIPGSDLLVSGGKEGPIYLLDAKMAIKQTVRPPAVKDRDGLHSLAAWNGSAGPMVYAWPSGGQLYAYSLANGQLSLKSMVGLKAGHPGGTVTISSNGTMPNTGIAWATIARTGDSWHGTAIGTLFAYDATDVSKELWNSDDVDANNMGNYAKFSPPVVANGKVYVASFSGKIMVFGLKK